MGGKQSRDKGKRNEYVVRDYFRGLGYTADRVPSSGAAQGFPGDIKVSKDGHQFLIEVKSRKCTFKSIYDFYNEWSLNGNPVFFMYENKLVSMTKDFKDLTYPKAYYIVFHEDAIKKNKRVLNKILNLEKYLKGKCDYLVIKDDNKPLIFLRFADVSPSQKD